MKILELLKNAGCNPRNYGSYLTCAATYRGGSDAGSVGIYLTTNKVTDFVTGQTFSLESFLAKTLNIDAGTQLQEILKDNATYFAEAVSAEDPFNKTEMFYPEEDIAGLVTDSSYWVKRGISASTQEIFGGGVCQTGKMYQRYVFPILNARGKIQGFSGRDLTGRSKIKWKHIGKRNEWAYPFKFNHNTIADSREIILVESIGDMLSLWESGIKNTGVTFGTGASAGLLKAIIRLNPRRIIIATNNDKNGAGQRAAAKIKNSLTTFFDQEQLVVAYPDKNDFGDQSAEENKTWYSKL
jgi:5S rRNA maturation endonuclease (ribonuclease M5)